MAVPVTGQSINQRSEAQYSSDHHRHNDRDNNYSLCGHRNDADDSNVYCGPNFHAFGHEHDHMSGPYSSVFSNAACHAHNREHCIAFYPDAYSDAVHLTMLA